LRSLHDSGGPLFHQCVGCSAPVWHVADTVCVFFLKQRTAYDIGHGLGFGFFDSAVLDVFGITDVFVHQCVCSFVNHGFSNLGRGEFVMDRNFFAAVGGSVAIGSGGDVFGFYGPALGGNVVAHGGGDALGIFSGQLLG